MDNYKARLASFSKTKRTLGWPHPAAFVARPATLAAAGFFFVPSADDPDNVQCFMCSKELGGWEEEDDPYRIHWEKCAGSCAWALARCGVVCGR